MPLSAIKTRNGLWDFQCRIIILHLWLVFTQVYLHDRVTKDVQQKYQYQVFSYHRKANIIIALKYGFIH